MKLRRLALILLPVLVFVLAAPAWAEGEEGGGSDLKAQIKKKMEGILELMKQNEAALLKLSSGQSAKPRKVDLDVPDPQSPDQPPSGAAGSEGTSGSSGSAKGNEIGKKLDELIRGQRESGQKIPDELKQLVEMIPL